MNYRIQKWLSLIKGGPHRARRVTVACNCTSSSYADCLNQALKSVKKDHLQHDRNLKMAN